MSATRAAVAVATRVYGAALVCCPAAIRRTYGDEMRATFAARSTDAARIGSLAVIALLLSELGDLFTSRAASRRFGVQCRSLANPFDVGPADWRKPVSVSHDV